MRSRNIKEYVTEDRHIWRLGMQRSNKTINDTIKQDTSVKDQFDAKIFEFLLSVACCPY